MSLWNNTTQNCDIVWKQSKEMEIWRHQVWKSMQEEAILTTQVLELQLWSYAFPIPPYGQHNLSRRKILFLLAKVFLVDMLGLSHSFCCLAVDRMAPFLIFSDNMVKKTVCDSWAMSSEEAGRFWSINVCCFCWKRVDTSTKFCNLSHWLKVIHHSFCHHSPYAVPGLWSFDMDFMKKLIQLLFIELGYSTCVWPSSK